MNCTNLHVVNSRDHLQIVRIGGYKVTIPKICFELFLHLVCSFICECNHHNAVSHFMQRDILRIADKANTGNHSISFTRARSGANYNVLFRRGMFNLVLFKVKLALLTEFLEYALLSRTILAVLDYKGSCILIERRTYHAHGAMEAHEHIIDRSHRKSMAFLLVKCNFDIVAIAY